MRIILANTQPGEVTFLGLDWSIYNLVLDSSWGPHWSTQPDKDYFMGTSEDNTQTGTGYFMGSYTGQYTDWY